MKRKTRTIIVVMVILFRMTCSTFSQEGADTGSKQSGFHIGMSYINLKEESLNKVIHKGPGLVGAVYLERSKNRSVKIFDMELGSGFLKSGFESEASSYWFSGSASFRYLWRLSNVDPGFNFYLGGKVKAGTAIEYFDNWDESHFYWITSYSIGVDFRFDYSFGSNSKIRIEGDLPFLSMVSRPPAEFLYTQSSPALQDVLKDINQDLRFLSPVMYRDFNIQLEYSLRNPKKFFPAIFWRLNYLSIKKDGSAQLKYINQTFGLEFRF